MIIIRKKNPNRMKRKDTEMDVQYMQPQMANLDETLP